ncbi:SPOR domain-containing protein [Lacibacter luteus]|uniref:SPOR domain-containing protein n=1 Tax=Lacibacter luteus TaxID=2508719 RepID=A0A4Q1CPS3_9BACT|nr:SPOR domain-containing protein [Lacibacter luteus]RXK62731.1 SPOR domain-containing protein [Lacibacter luteus]
MQITKIIYIILTPLVLVACAGPKKSSSGSPASTTKTVTKKMVDGYQLQVLNTTNRNDALEAKSLLLSKYPQQKTFLLFQTPYYKIRFGNFLTQSEAVNYQKKIKSHFTNVFVIPVKFEIKVEE